jgi:signal transduction histidine kinase
MRESESRRPFLDYLSDDRFQQLMEDCRYDATLRSPLAEGPVDPLIWAHFQIDDVGVITMPTLPGVAVRPGPADSPTLSEGPMQEAILSELECANSEHLAALRRTAGTGRARELPSPQGLVTVGPFSWHTVVIEEAPALVALREVSTPSAVLTQGFVVPGERLGSLLDGALFPAHVRPGDPGDVTEAVIPIEGDRWTVGVDASLAFVTAAEEATRMRSRFLMMFAIGAFAAMIAGGVVVLLVHETDRTARERARFAASAAHELRTPLAGLQLYGEMLAEGSGDPTRHATYGRRVADEADRLGRVVSNVLGFSKLQRHGLVVHPRTGALEPALRTSIDRLRPWVESAGASIDLQIASDIPVAVFDADALHQILQNLIDNAAKFNRDADDRTIHVTASSGQARPTIIRTRALLPDSGSDSRSSAPWQQPRARRSRTTSRPPVGRPSPYDCSPRPDPVLDSTVRLVESVCLHEQLESKSEVISCPVNRLLTSGEFWSPTLCRRKAWLYFSKHPASRSRSRPG